MRKIANILTKNLFNDKIFYNVVDNKNDLIDGIPVLCVGVELTKKNYPNFKILDMSIDDNTYWTYGPREKRNIYESRLKIFIQNAIEIFKSKIQYKYVNVVVNGTLSPDFQLVNNIIFREGKKIVSFLFNGIVYVYDNDKTVYGISLRELNYIGENVKMFLGNVYGNTTVITNKDSIPLDVRILFNGYDYLIPCLFSNDNECSNS